MEEDDFSQLSMIAPTMPASDAASSHHDTTGAAPAHYEPERQTDTDLRQPDNLHDSLDATSRPEFLPSSSLLTSDAIDAPHDVVDEAEMTKHLMDIESSFAAPPSMLSGPEPVLAQPSWDFEAATAQPLPESSILLPPLPEQSEEHTTSTAYSRDSQSSTDHETDRTTSSLETMSSPTAAAAARMIARTLPVDSTKVHEAAEVPSIDEPNSGHATPRVTRIDDNDDDLAAHELSLDAFTTNAGHTPGAALLKAYPSGRRPKFLRSRQTSQTSSISSVGNSEGDPNEPTLPIEDGLQYGGAIPMANTSRASSMMLARSISLGSIASGIEEYNGDTLPRPGDRKLHTLSEEDHQPSVDDLPPATPKASSRPLAAPTDTVIARHVRNVQVPDSVAKEYRNAAVAQTPFKSNGKNLTLKEQSNTIERLSKENFDLKLKVMFLSDRLDKLSEEGVKEMISENVELKTGLAVVQRDNKSLRRKIRELEKKLNDEEQRPDTSHSTASVDDRGGWFDQEGAQEREEELIFLRERIEEYEIEIEKMRNDSLHRETEKRKLAEALRSMGERRGEDVGAREELDVWKDLLEQETARREQADEENRKLREEVFRLRSEATGLAHTTNIYNISKKRTVSPSRPRSVASERLIEDRAGASSQATTLVEQLRRENEQLRHENTELQREVGAQTSMLTSRNREKERLYQEIEDLKLGQRRATTSLTGESIFERSASRAFDRPQSRASAQTKQTNLSDEERDELENKNNDLRDQLNAVKMQHQELQRELDRVMEELEVAIEVKKDAESLSAELQEDLDTAIRDLQVMQADRDEALRGQDTLEVEFENLRKEAQEEIDTLEAELDDRTADCEKLSTDLTDLSDNFTALQNEMRSMTESVIKLEDDQEASLKRIAELQQEVKDQNKELETLENNLVDANTLTARLNVQIETHQAELSFLREEQDTDKLKIADATGIINSLEQQLRDATDRALELDQRIAAERKQQELIAGREKQEIQQVITDLNRQASTAKDEATRLRKNLSSQEVEAAEWKERLLELENNLREALGDLNGTRSSLLKSIAKLQRELEDNVKALDTSKASATEKDHIIKQRDALLESHGLEVRRMNETLDKEQRAHRTTKHQFEAFQKAHQLTTRTVAQQESRVVELETARQQDRKKIAALENAMKDQLAERNNLLLALWNRLSTLCGSDWAHNNSLINGRALPSLESVGTMLPGFSKNLLAAVKTIEVLVGNFNQRIRSVERDLVKEYQTLEHHLDARTKRLEKLEVLVRTSAAGNDEYPSELAKLQASIRVLKAENSSLRSISTKASKIPTYTDHASSPAPSVPTGPRSSQLDVRHASLARNNTTALETLGKAHNTGILDEAGEQRWIFRLRELERRLKAEREARLLDRDGARKRLEEGERRNMELQAELDRNKIRKDTA